MTRSGWMVTSGVLLLLLASLAGSTIDGAAEVQAVEAAADVLPESVPVQATQGEDLYLLTMDSSFHVVHYSGDPVETSTFDMRSTSMVFLPPPPPEDPFGPREGSGDIELVSFSGTTSDGAILCDALDPSGSLWARGYVSASSIRDLRLLPEATGTLSCWLVIQPFPRHSLYNVWFTSLFAMHQDEMDERALTDGVLIDGWTMVNDGDVIARKTYQRYEEFDDGYTRQQVTENTVLEIVLLPPLPEVSEIHAMGFHTPGEKPETGRQVFVCVEVGPSDDYWLVDCFWSGNLTPGYGDTELGCLYDYVPATGHGPASDTYGDKDVSVQMYFEHDPTGALVWKVIGGEYKVFFAKHGRDHGFWGNPNWFEYWGDDGAVPGLDAEDVRYDPTAGDSYGGYRDDTIFIGQTASGVHYDPPYTFEESHICPGGTFGGAEGINAVAEVLGHERRHQLIDYQWEWPSDESCADPDGPWGGCSDTDGDELPDEYEQAVRETSHREPDSCNVGGIRSRRYRDDGDEELDCMIAGDGAVGVPENDWANPGSQAEAIEIVPCALEFPREQIAAPVQPASSELPTRLSSGPPAAVGSYQESVSAMANDFAELTGQYSESGKDTDGDGLYDGLVLSVGVQLHEALTCKAVAWLVDATGQDIAWAFTPEALVTGTHMLELLFDGSMIWDSRLDGPYNVARVELRAGDHERVLDAGEDVLTTAAYSHTEFDPPAATFNGQFADMTRRLQNTDDPMGDLVVRVGLDVHDPGRYLLLAILSSGDEVIAVHNQVVNQPVGSHDAVVVFPRKAIYNHRADGPYTLKTLQLSDLQGNSLDYLTKAFTTTVPYDYTQFVYSDAHVDQATFGEQAVDDDGDGLYDSLDIAFTIPAEGYAAYHVRGALEDREGRLIAVAQRSPRGHLESPGTGTLGVSQRRVLSATLSFSGQSIRNHGVDGPYVLAALMVMGADGAQVDFLPSAYTTGDYRYTDFYSAATPTPTPTVTSVTPGPSASPTTTATSAPLTPRPTTSATATRGLVTPRPSLTPTTTRRPPRRPQLYLPLVVRRRR